MWEIMIYFGQFHLLCVYTIWKLHGSNQKWINVAPFLVAGKFVSEGSSDL